MLEFNIESGLFGKDKCRICYSPLVLSVSKYANGFFFPGRKRFKGQLIEKLPEVCKLINNRFG